MPGTELSRQPEKVLARLPYTQGNYCSDVKPDSLPTSKNTFPSSLDSAKVATIIEDRPLANLVPLILAFSAVLGPTWPIRIFHTPHNTKLFTDSPSITRLIESNQVTLRLLPPGLKFNSHELVSVFFTTPWIWENLAPAKHVLVFQADAILCANSHRTADDFLEYDFIGAPIKTDSGYNYNGGLSIRNREKMLQILQNWTRPAGQFEDQWYAARLRELPPKPNGEPAAKLPGLEVASQFSVETIWHEKPFGVHQVTRYQPDKLDEVYTWCPEYKLAVEGALHPEANKNAAILDFENITGHDLEPFRKD
ncbi:MAG: hypothetical protein Q9210_005825 [Variospora velana]